MNSETQRYKAVKELYPEVYAAGGERAVKHLAKTFQSHRNILNSPPAEKKSFEEFKAGRKALGLQSTKKDYQDYLKRLGLVKSGKKLTKKTSSKKKRTNKR